MPDRPPVQRRTLRMSEVSEQLGVAVSTVQRWVAADLLPHVRVGRVVLIEPEALDAFLTDHREGSVTTGRAHRAAGRPGAGR